MKTGDYEGKSNAEPYKTTLLSLHASDLASFDKVNWYVTFEPVQDEVWPEYQQDVLNEEVEGYSIPGAQDANKTMSSISHMFKLPGAYNVKVVGLKPSNFNRRKLKEGKKETKGKINNKTTKAKKNGKKKTKMDEVILANGEVRVRYARRDVVDLSSSDWDDYVEAIWTLKELSSAQGQERYNCSNFYNLDVFTTIHGGRLLPRCFYLVCVVKNSNLLTLTCLIDLVL